MTLIRSAGAQGGEMNDIMSSDVQQLIQLHALQNMLFNRLFCPSLFSILSMHCVLFNTMPAEKLLTN